MKQGRWRPAGLLVVAGTLLLAGCGLSTDPTQGGLFGYNPSAYEARQQQKRAALQDIESANQSYRADNQRLEQEKARKASTVAGQEKALAALRKDVKGLSSSIDKLNRGTAEQRAHAARLQRQQTALQQSVDRASQDSDLRRREQKIQSAPNCGRLSRKQRI